MVSLTEIVLSHVSIHWWLINKLLVLVDALEVVIIVDRSLMIESSRLNPVLLSSGRLRSALMGCYVVCIFLRLV